MRTILIATLLLIACGGEPAPGLPGGAVGASCTSADGVGCTPDRAKVVGCRDLKWVEVANCASDGGGVCDVTSNDSGKTAMCGPK